MSNKTKKCPYCGEDILAIAIKCKHCGSNIEGAGLSRSSSDYGILLLATPIVATLLIWFWVGNMNLLQSPTNSLALIMVLTIAGTAVVASIEASKAGMKTDRERRTYTPIEWFFMIILLWVVGYPAYLFRRSRYGLTNLLGGGIVVALIFVGSAIIINISIEQQKTQAVSILTNMQRQLENFASPNSPGGATSDPAPSGNARPVGYFYRENDDFVPGIYEAVTDAKVYFDSFENAVEKGFVIKKGTRLSVYSASFQDSQPHSIDWFKLSEGEECNGKILPWDNWFWVGARSRDFKRIKDIPKPIYKNGVITNCVVG